MKQCKSCQKEIEEKASKCPYCQAFQKWYKNPQFFVFVFLIIPLIFIMTSERSFFRPSYLDHKNDFVVSPVNISTNENFNIHTYNIANKSDNAWEDIKYQFIGLNTSGKVVVVQSEEEYSWKVQPNSESMISVETPKDSPAVKWEFKITDIRADRGI